MIPGTVLPSWGTAPLAVALSAVQLTPGTATPSQKRLQHWEDKEKKLAGVKGGRDDEILLKYAESALRMLRVGCAVPGCSGG